MGVIIFNGKSSQDYGILVEHPPEYQIPARDYEVVHIPGRNGDLVIDNGSYQNVNRTYQIAVGDIGKEFAVLANAVARWLHSASGYARLEDSYEPEYYRMAMFSEEASVENILWHAGRAEVNFNCKPQRFLKSGEEAASVPNGSVLWNPTDFCALPEIKIYGSGSGILGIGSYTVMISGIDGYVVLDSEIQDAYKGTVNKNSLVTLENGFPKLVPGGNQVNWSWGISKVEVVPRWWTL